MNYLCLYRNNGCIASLASLATNPDEATALLRALPGVASSQPVATPAR
jgi:hypothetical protein